MTYATPRLQSHRWPETFTAIRTRLKSMWDSGYDAGMRGRVYGERINYPCGYSKRINYPCGYSKRERVAFLAGLQYALRDVPRHRQPWMRLYPAEPDA